MASTKNDKRVVEDPKEITAEVFRQPSDEEIAIVRERRGYLEVSHKPPLATIKAADPQIDLNDPDVGYPIAVNTNSDWALQYYPKKGKNPARASVSAGQEVFGWTGEEDGDVDTMKGSYQLQGVSTTIELINFCLLQGWKGFTIVDGTDFMKWACWAYLDSMGTGSSGYKPTAHDELRAKNCAGIFNKAQQFLAQAKKATPSGVSGTSDDTDDSD